MSTVEIVLQVVSILLWVWFFWNLYKLFKITKRIRDERNEAQEEALKYRVKYKYLVAAIFELKSAYALQCEIEETQERALMQHAAICELLFRAGLAGTGGNQGDDGEN